MRKLFLTLLFSFILVTSAYAQTWFVDNGTKEADATWDETDGHAYSTVAQGSGIGYSTMEECFNNFLSSGAPGDTIYLRGGTYSENYGSTWDSTSTSTSMPMPWAVDGTSFEPAGRILIASYPGEWAILDGNASAIAVTGFYGSGATGGGSDNREPEYWVMERLEITGCADGQVGTGLAIEGGPWKIRYCYIHDNPGAHSENSGGLRGYIWSDGALVEYCYFYNNTNANGWNCGHIVIFSDYTYDDDNTPRDNWTFASTRHGYEVRYCIFDDSYSGIQDKAIQYLATSNSDYTYEDYGPKIHHNLFKNLSFGIQSENDFLQCYNNIFDNCRVQLTLIRGGVGSSRQDVAIYNRVVYNNTVIEDPISFNVGYDEDVGINTDFRGFCYNNIVTGFGSDSYVPSIGFYTMGCQNGGCDSAQGSCTPNWATSIIDRNLIHDPQVSDHIGQPYSSVAKDWYTVSEFNSARSVTNYTNATAGLFEGESGADQYITDGTFVVSGATTIADGGIDTSHPYLSGVTIPDYIGATDPSNITTNNWPKGLLDDLTSTTWLCSMSTDRDANDDPTWIADGEGGEEDPATVIYGVSFVGASIGGN